MSNDRKAYQQKIIERCNWRLENDLDFELSSLKRGEIAEQVLKLVCDNNLLDETDQSILKLYFETSNEAQLPQLAKNKKDAMGKAMYQLLTGKTQRPQNRLLDISALLVDLQPRPFNKNFDYAKLNIENASSSKKELQKSKITPKSSTIRPLVKVGSIIVLVSIVALSIYKKGLGLILETISKPDITINAEHIVVSDLNRIVPNENTDFFNKNGEPKVWYTNYNGQIELYDTMGIHPQTNELLKPVTTEIVRTVSIESSATKEKTYKPERQESNHKSKPYLLNTGLKNGTSKKEISLFMMDNNYKLDADATATIGEYLKQKGYIITVPLIASKDLNQNVVLNLRGLNQDYFKADLNQFTDYLCIGTVTYDYSESTINKDLKTCNVSLNYTIVSTKERKDIDTLSKSVSGTGSNEQSAKQNALHKLTL
ncbi:MAG: hypothetical protein ACK5M1_07150 [Xanthomarina gelatinilytica]|uniref:hypothetical protein n=1 Tax=Xanthomarina gelatinilytica TaxID=1137281 RepID=UPI003A836113